MTRQEYLMNRYEDALFSLMMDKVATQEGEKALLELERLQQEALNDVPETLHHKCLKAISRYFARKRAKAVRHTVSNVISKIAIVALVGILTFTIAFATSPAFRANTMNFVMEMFDDHAEFRFEGGTSPHSSDMEIIANWIPDGYILSEKYSDDIFNTLIYTNSVGGRFDISTYNTEITAELDTENMHYSEIDIEGNCAHLLQDDSAQIAQIIWLQSNNATYIRVSGENLAVQDLIRIAENISVK